MPAKAYIAYRMSKPGSDITCILALEDGTYFRGQSFGAGGTRTGEVVFNTAITGYQEVLTDPSYCGQIVTMTAPQIGNYGINAADVESAKPQVAGFVVKEAAKRPSNFRADMSLAEYLAAGGIIGIEGIDTRALTRKLRVDGSMRGVITTEHDDPIECVRLARESPSMVGADLVKMVAPKQPYDWAEGLDPRFVGRDRGIKGSKDQEIDNRQSTIDNEILRCAQNDERRTIDHRPSAIGNWRSAISNSKSQISNRQSAIDNPLVLAIDCGMKRNILRNLVAVGCRVKAIPPTWRAAQILEHKPDGIFSSNGPGDPEAVGYMIETLRELIGKVPIFGICLGHQLLALAMGARTFKMKFGHRGANQPVRNLTTGRIEITSQNHGFAVDADSLEAAGGIATHINLNDQTLEGFVHKDLPILAVQYHPEAAPGPHDAMYLFQCFTAMMMNSGAAPARLA